MTLLEWTILLAATGVLLLVAELLLPTHGLLGLAGGGAILGAIGCCFAMNVWIGTAAFVGTLISAPFVGALAIRLFPRTPVGRRIVLPPTPSSPSPVPVQIGQIGVTVSELRPMGECDFDDQRIEVISEIGIIARGTKVCVVAMNGRLPTVRPA